MNALSMVIGCLLFFLGVIAGSIRFRTTPLEIDDETAVAERQLTESTNNLVVAMRDLQDAMTRLEAIEKIRIRTEDLARRGGGIG